jgi:hypothetical protein
LGHNNETHGLSFYRNGVAVGGTHASLTVTSGDDLILSIKTITSGGDVLVRLLAQRASDGFYLKPDGTYQAGEITFRAEGDYVDTSPPAAGKGGVDFFVYSGETTEYHCDSLTITTAAAADDGGDLAITGFTGTPGVGSVGLAWDYTGGTVPVFHVHRSTTASFTPSGSTAGAGTCLAVVTDDVSYTDSAAVAGTLYFYVVVATDPSVAGATSAEVACEPYRMDLPVAFLGDSLYGNTPSGGSPPPTYFGTLDLPGIHNVKSGVTFDNTTKTGDCAVPAASDVRNGTSVSLGAGTLVVPSVANVAFGVTFDNGSTGTSHVPMPPTCDAPWPWRSPPARPTSPLRRTCGWGPTWTRPPGRSTSRPPPTSSPAWSTTTPPRRAPIRPAAARTPAPRTCDRHRPRGRHARDAGRAGGRRRPVLGDVRQRHGRDLRRRSAWPT